MGSETGASVEAASLMAVAGPERVELLALARLSVERALVGGSEPGIAPVLSTLREPRAAFVTVRRVETGRLRGCRGECPARRPLPECVRSVALYAALDDPRFPPVTHAELPVLRFEISALTNPVPVVPQDIVVGTHGLLLSGSAARGLLLPQVPVEQGWDRDAYLEGLCFKAGVPAGSWRDPDVLLFAFEAEVWAEV